MDRFLKSGKFLVIAFVLVALISFAIGATVPQTATTGQTVVWNGSDWTVLNNGILFPTAGSPTVCFSASCDKNVSYVGSDFVFSTP